MTSKAEAQRFHPTCPPRRARGGARWGVESRRNEVRLSRRGAGFAVRRRTPHHRRPACSAPTLRLAVSGGVLMTRSVRALPLSSVLGKTGDTAGKGTASGSLSFPRGKLSDTHTVGNSLVSATWSGGATLPSGLSTVLASALTTSVSSDSTGSGSGLVGFTFSAADNTFDFLAAGQMLTIIYNVTVTDNSG